MKKMIGSIIHRVEILYNNIQYFQFQSVTDQDQLSSLRPGTFGLEQEIFAFLELNGQIFNFLIAFWLA